MDGARANLRAFLLLLQAARFPNLIATPIEKQGMNESIYGIPLRRIEHHFRSGRLSRQGGAGQRISACGLTPQYAQLEKLYEERRMPAWSWPAFHNDFKAQEPGSTRNRRVLHIEVRRDVPVFEDLRQGPNQHPLYKRLIEAQPHAREKPGSDFRAKQASYGLKPDNETDILWNFEKFLIDRSGRVIDRFTPNTVPDDAVLKDAIEKALAA
jgi:glutathione peroxidase